LICRPEKPKPYSRLKVERWGERKDIPVNDRQALKRSVQELLDQTRSQRRRRKRPAACAKPLSRQSLSAAAFVASPH
jgi:hypothetical protein